MVGFIVTTPSMMIHILKLMWESVLIAQGMDVGMKENQLPN